MSDHDIMSTTSSRPLSFRRFTTAHRLQLALHNTFCRTASSTPCPTMIRAAAPLRRLCLRPALHFTGAVAAAAGGGAAVATAAFCDSEEPTLPASWVAVVDNASGKTYYHNPDTQATQWSHPGASAPTTPPGRLQGKGAIVTGGGTGIGRGLALALAAEGCGVLVTGRRAEPLEGTVQAAEGLAGSVVAHQCDAADPDQTPLLQTALAEFGGTLDILVNNAGINIPQRALAELSVEVRGPACLHPFRRFTPQPPLASLRRRSSSTSRAW